MGKRRSAFLESPGAQPAVARAPWGSCLFGLGSRPLRPIPLGVEHKQSYRVNETSVLTQMLLLAPAQALRGQGLQR